MFNREFSILTTMSRNLTLRILTGLPLAAAFCWYIFAAGEPAFIIISGIIGMIGYYEYAGALRKKEVPVSRGILYLSLLLLYLAFYFYNKGRTEAVIWILVADLLVTGTASLFYVKKNNTLFLWYLFPVLWIVLPIFLLYKLRFDIIAGRGSELIFFLILVAAFNDIFAYFGGKRFGSHPLAPSISPKKTIEGSLFGIVGGLISGSLMILLFLSDLFPVWKMLITIVVVVIASQIGDLIESKFKRYCGIKDSSALIPGHGGLLDRIDAYLLALPVFICLIYLLKIT